jgi:Sulfotransferase domain
MLIISAGMPKSGTAYIYNVLNGLLVAAGFADARTIRDKHGLGEVMRWHNNNVSDLSVLRLLRLWLISRSEGRLVVKTHEPPSTGMKLLSSLGCLRVVYIYRDPRDVLLSAIDHGVELLKAGQTHTFASMVEFDKALAAVQTWLATWRAYRAMHNVLALKYEDLLADPVSTLRSCEAFLGLTVTDRARDEVLWQYNRANPDVERQYLHLNKAVAFRYRSEMSPAWQARCREELAASLHAMGYSTD